MIANECIIIEKTMSEEQPTARTSESHSLGETVKYSMSKLIYELIGTAFLTLIFFCAQ